MSKAVICDKCGKVMDERMKENVHTIWTVNPLLFDTDYLGDDCQVHLCDEHYKEFEDEYLANLKESYGQDIG